jgi:hypothetical protein
VWIGVDLDGTLAKYKNWKGPYDIGPPVRRMVTRLKRWLKAGIEVRIMTARVADPDPEIVRAIEAYCLKHVGQKLPVTNQKDFNMLELWDDRAVSVLPNKGVPCMPVSRLDDPTWGEM